MTISIKKEQKQLKITKILKSYYVAVREDIMSRQSME